MSKFTKTILISAVIFTASGLNIYYYWEPLWTMWARYYLKNQDIVISLTTTPHRIRELEAPLQCLAQQNIPIRQIFINIPYIFKRDNLEYKIPDWLDVYPNVTILRTEDYGPATKILGALKNAPLRDDTIIISVDDDSCYPPNLVMQLAVRAKMYPNEAIGVSGAILDFEMNKEGGIIKIMRDRVSVPLLEGFAGIAYRAKFFNDTIYNIRNEPAFCYNSDDLYLSFHLALNNIPRRTLHNKSLKTYNIRQEQFGYKEDALFKLEEKLGKSQAQRYAACLRHLTDLHPNVNFSNHKIQCKQARRSVCTDVEM
ncbi:MAG TPA: hypothetical protein VLG38_08465 [Gammaproteobacteria bacterium]|nr:hypothetical protein [Gammaproteobacteria bacterium]